MSDSGPRRGLRVNAGNEWRKLRSYDWRAHFTRSADGAVRGTMAGLGPGDLRSLARGEPPPEGPDPRYRAQFNSFLLHIRPKYYRRASTWFSHTWRLGWLSVFFFLVEAVTGLLLMLYYAPTPERAYDDMVHLIGGVPFGQFLRDLHRLGAEAMVVVVALHLARVFFTGAYKGRRRLTWVTGVVLLLLTLGLSFSGYLLPWDQLSYWAVTIGTSMAAAAPLIGKQLNLLLCGAVDIWASGLLRFYLLHVLALPLVALVFISIHYYRVARIHSISLPASVVEGDLTPEARRHAEQRVDLIPDLLVQELMLAAVVLFLMVAAVATFYHAPLELPADPQVTPLHTTAPWYFLWLQGLLKLGDKQVMGVGVPVVLIALLLVLPWLDRNPYRLARRRRAAVTMGALVCASVILLTYMGTPSYGIDTPPAQDILAQLVPATRPGPLREVAWSQLGTAPDGGRKTYFVSYPPGWEKDPQYADRARYEFLPTAPTGELDQFHQVLWQFKAAVENEPRLIAPVDGQEPLAKVTVERFQPGLKWVEATINWDELATSPDTGQQVLKTGNSLAAKVAIDRDSGYGQ